MASHINGETYFFRDHGQSDLLRLRLLPELIERRRNAKSLRLWSAGCATGEEPYSMAILLHRLIPDLADWRITILGTDINPKFLARADAGVYSEWSFRDTPDWVKPRYFEACSDNRYEIHPWLKRMVSFAYLNLVDDVYPSVLNGTNAMDLIVCRNVLLYFAPARIPQVVQRFHRALLEGGHLVMGAVEASQITFTGFTHVPAPGVALYRKGSTQAAQGIAGVDSRTMSGGLADGPFVVTAPAAASLASSIPVPAPPPPLVGAGRSRDDDAQAAGLLAHRHANLGELAEALVWCERALALAKTDSALHFLRAGILQELQRPNEALLALRNVLFLDPGHVLAHFTMANLYRRQDQPPAAEKHLANVRRLLASRDKNEELPQSGGLTVGRLNGILDATKGLAAEKEVVSHE